MKAFGWLLVMLGACADAPGTTPMALDPAAPWVRHTIYAGLQGADGHALADVDGDGDLDAAVAWEQSAKVTISLQPADPTGPWPTTTLFTVAGAEDVAIADFDGDGALDVVGAGQGKKIVVAFGHGDGTFGAGVTLAAATGLQYYMALAPVDTDGDGDVEIVVGGRVAFPPRILAFHSGPDPRDGAAWTLEEIGPCGWTMALIARDVDGDGDPDLLTSDRQWYSFVSGGVRTYDKRGTRWLERTSVGWINHPISSPPAGKTARFLVDGGSFLLDGYAADSGTASDLTARAGWDGWAGTSVPWPATMGAYQAGALADMNGDGVGDLIVSAAAAVGVLEGVQILMAPAWTPYSVSGAAGEKFDEIEARDIDRDGRLDIITTEQNEGLGAVWYSRP